MTKYTEAALMTTKNCQGAINPDVRGEWLKAIISLKAYDEVCPRGAYIGLCEEGLVKGIPSGNYGLSSNNKNKRYAVHAAHLLLGGHELSWKTLWRTVTDRNIAHHDQMNIVIILHQAGMLRFENEL